MKKGLDEDVWVPGGPLDESGKPVPSALMIVGEGPGREEIARGEVLVGPTGKETDNLLRRVIGIQREEVYATNVMKYLGDTDMDLMTKILAEEIAEVNPEVILALGAVATNAFLGDDYDMETLNAMPHRWGRRVIVPSFHPAVEFHDSTRMTHIILAFKTAKQMLRGGKVNYEEGKPTRCYHARGSQQFGDIIGIDTESLKDGTSYMVTVSSREGTGGYLLCGKDDLSALSQHVSRSGVLTVLHNALYDLPILRDLNVIPTSWADTMVLAFMSQMLPLSLRSLAYRLLRRRLRDYSDLVGPGQDLDTVPFEEVVQYACAHADATYSIFNLLSSIVEDNGMTPAMERDMDIMPMVVDMMENGMKLDKGYIANLSDEFTIRNIVTNDKINEMAGREINPASDKQVSHLLYKELGLGKGVRIPKTKWGGSRDQKTLKKIQHTHPIVPLILDWKEIDTLIDKYLNVLPGKMDRDERIRTKLSLVRVPHSGRLASSNPNLMAQPVRTEDGKRIRDGFIAEDGWRLVSFDYNQAEMRIMAHLSQDPVMTKAYKNKEDIHTKTAMEVFGLRQCDVDEMKHRYPSKRAGFGIINFITGIGLSRELMSHGLLEWTEDRCDELLRAWFDIYKGVRQYMDETRNEIKRRGYIVDMWGRMELIPEIKSIFYHIREAGLRRGGNQPIQSGAQGMIKEAMRLLWVQVPLWRHNHGIRIRPLLQIHDDLLWEIWKPDIPIVSPDIKRIMEGAVELTVPVTVDAKEGRSWGSMTPLTLPANN